ncbi:hypothetical protein NDU88_006786 [Pleurodeles waltl]|uniref:Uncharacterized protein n=1 Tax=Pleurodeles waltl TaxID=8319 RepID=A0AAV7QMY8_PLEWA|nr:hypothetical protein NDU88_006786 [Pleurodeles waltl]
MECITESLAKNAERLDMAELIIPEAKDEHVTAAQKRMNKLLLTLQAKVEDLNLCSGQINLQILGIAESTNIDNREHFVEQLISDLLGCEIYLQMLVVERAHCSLAPHPIPGALPHPIIDRLLNHRGRDATLRWARELKILNYGGTVLSLYPYFIQHEQEAQKRFVPAKLREMQLEYNVLYPASFEFRLMQTDPDVNVVTIVMDAEKVFKSVEGSFMRAVLKRIGRETYSYSSPMSSTHD